MNEPLTLIAIGVVLLASLISLLRRRESERESEIDNVTWFADGSSTRPSAQFEDREKEQLDRIFGCEDWDFIRGSTPRRVQELFLKERKCIALSWLSQLRQRARAGMRLHLTSVRASKELEPLAELRLAIDYYVFLIKCDLIAVILLLGGPMALRKMVGRAQNLSNNLREMLEAGLKSEMFSQNTKIH
jgi:hypothetical protein